MPSTRRVGGRAQARAEGGRGAHALGPGRRSVRRLQVRGALLADRLDLTTARFRDSPFAIDGTLIRVHVDRSSPLSESVGGSVWVMFSDDDTIRVRPSSAPLRYPRGGLETSGPALHTQQLAGQPAAVDEALGEGRVLLFPFDLSFRGMAQGTQRLLWDAIFGR